MKKYFLNLNTRSFNNILNKKKDIEGRLNEGAYKNIRKNDVLYFSNVEDRKEKRLLEVKVLKVMKFDTFQTAFTQINHNRAIPGYSFKEVIDIYSRYYSRIRQKKYGVVLFQIILKTVCDGL